MGMSLDPFEARNELFHDRGEAATERCHWTEEERADCVDLPDALVLRPALDRRGSEEPIACHPRKLGA